MEAIITGAVKAPKPIRGIMMRVLEFYKKPRVEVNFKKSIEEINLEALKTQAKQLLRDAQALNREAFDLLSNAGAEKEARRTLEIAGEIEKILRRL